MFRSIAAIMAGYVAMVLGLLTFATATHSLAADGPSTGYLALTLTAGLLIAVGGGYLAAVIAKRKELLHGITLGVVTGILGAYSISSYPPGIPAWYSVGNVVVGFMGAIAGAAIRARLLPRSAE